MKMRTRSKKRLNVMRAVPACVLGLVSFTSASAASLAPPPYEVMNRHGVNMATGQVSPSLNTVSIGGGLGLSHSISTFSSNFVNWEGEGPLGYRDRFYGRVMKGIHHKPPGVTNPDAWIWTMKVFDIGGSMDFLFNADGTYTSYTGDPRHTLEFKPGLGFVWTKPDGTVVTYNRPSYTSTGNNVEILAGVSEIKYPNGFTVAVTSGDVGARVTGATSNTGYQLKYVYVPRQEVLELPDDPSNTRIPPIQTWSGTMPRFVAAINNAVDYCPIDAPGTTNYYASLSDACAGQLTTDWPKATFNWPGGMPRVMYLGDTVFSVADAIGGVTEFKNRAFKKNDACTENDPQYRTPRIVSIKSSAANVAAVSYDYQSLCTMTDAGEHISIWAAGPIAQLKSSAMDGDAGSYSLNNPYTPAPGAKPTTSINGGGGYHGINYVYVNIDYGVAKFDAWDKFVSLEAARSNRLYSIQDKLSGVLTEFGYDARYNLTFIKKNGVLVQSAEYPASCDNRKTCNQATWIKDANGNQTDYEYDANSGQVTRVRLPADRNGVRAETRYTYEPKYAYYKTSANGYQKAASPVYMLTRERKCLTSAMKADGSGCMGDKDDIVTDYDYGPDAGPNNLNLRGVAVTAYVDGVAQVRRACYAYDAYGNRIGETKPKAGLTSCP